MKNCFFPADILLPDLNKTDFHKWAVIACDQFTSEMDYWDKVEECVGDAPSALRVTLPEIYLSNEAEVPTKIKNINDTMRVYEKDVLVSHNDAMIYVERVQSNGKKRCGIVGKVDLECYEYKANADSLIRATEGTVLERIPPRVNIRRDAPIELPHVMLLIDDRKKSVIEPLENKKESLPVAYDFDLMAGGGHITGRFLDEAEKDRVASALGALCDGREMSEKYGKDGIAPLLFAVGDGNHSLAAAKAAYEEIKAKLGDAAKDHSARYALVEIVNLHDTGLEFEPIYRVLFSVDPDDVVSSLEDFAKENKGNGGVQNIEYISSDSHGNIVFENAPHELAVGSLQKFIDAYIAEHNGASVDYIHGEKSLETLAKKENAIGFLFSGMQKNELFKTVIFEGALPRKTFSMGHAEDKRYYLEARKIK